MRTILLIVLGVMAGCRSYEVCDIEMYSTGDRYVGHNCTTDFSRVSCDEGSFSNVRWAICHPANATPRVK